MIHPLLYDPSSWGSALAIKADSKVLWVSDKPLPHPADCQSLFPGHHYVSLNTFLALRIPYPKASEGFDVVVLNANALPFSFWLFLKALHRASFPQGRLIISGADQGTSREGPKPAGTNARWVYFLSLLKHMGWTLDCSESVADSIGVAAMLYRTSVPRWYLEEVTIGDFPEIAALFYRVFHAVIDPSLFSWKYGNELGRSILARSSQGDLLAHYGATSRRLSLMGKEALALQICDVMVDPVERGILGRHGLFFKVARAFQEAYYGYSREFQLAYGFPNARAMRLAHKLGLYEKVDHLLEISWSLKRSLRSYCFRGEPLSLERFSSHQMDDLWEKMRPGLNEYIAVIRDAAYLRYRYFDHPTFFYNALLIKHRMTGRVLGLVFLKEEEDHVKLMDVVGKIQDIQGLLMAACASLVGSGSKPLKAWVTPRQWEVFKGPGATAVTTDIEIPTHTATPGIPVAELQGRWWVSFGDTDFL